MKALHRARFLSVGYVLNVFKTWGVPVVPSGDAQLPLTTALSALWDSTVSHWQKAGQFMVPTDQ